MLLLRVILLYLALGFAVARAGVNIEKQLREQRNALRSLEQELAQQRNQLRAMESEEKGVLNTISLLDQNLGQTKDYVQQLSRTERTLSLSMSELQQEIDSIRIDIAEQQNAMRMRVRQLYMQGRRSQTEQLWRLLRQKENPERQLYQVRRLLRDDQNRVFHLKQSQMDRQEKELRLQSRVAELSHLRTRKQTEESGLLTQLQRQQQELDGLRQDKEKQQQALDEFEQNQRMMITLIEQLENRRKQDEAARAAERKRKGSKATVKQVVTAVGPKCVPLKGELISEFGMHEHPVLHTMTRNLGIEIRAERGEAIRAAASGKVVAVTHLGGRGQAVIIEHANAIYSVYGHMRATNVQMGQEVRYCQEIGQAGDEESMNGPKLYFQISQGVHTIDPVQWLGGLK